MTIRPGKGLDQLLFGLSERELIQILGPPDKQYRSDSETLRLQYFALRIEFSIEPDNGDRFGWAEVHNADAILFGHRVVGEPIGSVPALVAEALGEEPEYTDVGSFERYFYAQNWVEILVEFGRIRNVNFGVLYDDTDEPSWPSAQPPPVAD